MFRLSIVLPSSRLALAPEPFRYTPYDEKLRIVLLRIVPEKPVRFTPVWAHSIRACSISTPFDRASTPRQEPRDGLLDPEVSTTSLPSVPCTVRSPSTTSRLLLPWNRSSAPAGIVSDLPAGTNSVPNTS